jgi:hypothetical protein
MPYTTEGRVYHGLKTSPAACFTSECNTSKCTRLNAPFGPEGTFGGYLYLGPIISQDVLYQASNPRRLTKKWSMTSSVHSAVSAAFGQFLHYLRSPGASQCMMYSLKMLASRDGIFSPSELSWVNFLYFGIIWAGFHEIDFYLQNHLISK